MVWTSRLFVKVTARPWNFLGDGIAAARRGSPRKSVRGQCIGNLRTRQLAVADQAVDHQQVRSARSIASTCVAAWVPRRRERHRRQGRIVSASLHQPPQLQPPGRAVVAPFVIMVGLGKGRRREGRRQPLRMSRELSAGGQAADGPSISGKLTMPRASSRPQLAANQIGIGPPFRAGLGGENVDRAANSVLAVEGSLRVRGPPRSG